MPTPINDDFMAKVRDLEISRKNTHDNIASGTVNAGIMLYKLGAFLKQTYKSINQRDLREQEFDESLRHNIIAQVSYKKAIDQSWILFLKANSERNAPYERIEALFNLNKIYLPGKQGRLIQELVRKLNVLYFTKEGILKLLTSKPDRKYLSKFVSLFLRIISKNKQEAQSFIELAKYYQITDFTDDLTDNINNDFTTVQDDTLEKILYSIIPGSYKLKIDQKTILENKFNYAFREILKNCKLDLTNPKYNPYTEINKSYLEFQRLQNTYGQNIQLHSNYFVPIQDFIADRSLLFDDFNMLKIFGADPAYIELCDKEHLLLDETYRDKIFKSLRDRYSAVAKIMQNLNLSNTSHQTQTFLYSLLDKPITLDRVLKAIYNQNSNTQTILEDLFNDKGILKAFEERTCEFPQFDAMPSCLTQPRVLKLLNRYLMFYPSPKLKSFFNEGINYLINPVDTEGQINFQNFHLAKAYYTLLNNADDRSVLISSDFVTGLSDFDCKYCVELNDNYLNELAHILRRSAKKLKIETDPYKKDLARFLIYAIQHLKKYNYSTSREQFDNIIKYLKNTLDEPIEVEEFLGTFTNMLEEVKTADANVSELLFIGPKLHKKTNKQTSAFIAKISKLIHQRKKVNNFYKQLHYAKHSEFYNQLDSITALCSSVLYKAETILDNEALEIAKTVDILSYKQMSSQ